VLVQAFDRVAATRPGVTLVVAGPDGWGVDAYQATVDRARHRDRIRRVGYVAEADRASLLAGAAMLAYPSRYEGFGHPPLEAMQVGVPVVAARAGALPEVLGNAALLPDPDDVDAVAEALARVLDDAALRARLVGSGSERVQRFSWAEAGQNFLAMYRQLAVPRD
jgi:glycosyltransferase involved in cell wall biosynthesis